jgi:hypothetical protein
MKSKTCSVQAFILDMLDVSTRTTKNARQTPKIKTRKQKAMLCSSAFSANPGNNDRPVPSISPPPCYASSTCYDFADLSTLPSPKKLSALYSFVRWFYTRFATTSWVIIVSFLWSAKGSLAFL